MVSVQRVSCAVTIQRTNSAGSAISQDEMKSACVDLCRDEFGVMIISVVDNGKSERTVNFPVSDPGQVRIFQRFIGDGKLSIQLSATNNMILLRNAPTDQLKTFLKALICKPKVKSGGRVPTQSERLLSVKARSLVDISPLQVNEMKSGVYVSPNSNFLKQGAPTTSSQQQLLARTPSARVSLGGDQKGGAKVALKRAIYSPEDCKENRKLAKMTTSRSDSALTTPTTRATFSSRSSLASERAVVPAAVPATRRPAFGLPETKISLFHLCDEQQRVLSAIKSGINVFLTGCAGTGKSFLLKRIIGMLSPEDTFVTASTGVAASQIGGITLHSFAGIGAGNGDLVKELTMAQRPAVANQWRRCRHLIIDEISMVDATFFTKLDQIARAIRQNERPFGGIQVIVSGDFLQLPPVNGVQDQHQQQKANNNLEPQQSTTLALPKRFAFQSPAWDICFGDAPRNVLLLRTVYRQSDSDFIRLLRLVRLGKCTDAVVQALRQTQNNPLVASAAASSDCGISATRLCTHNADAEFINSKQLDALPTDGKVFNAVDSDPSLATRFARSCHVPDILRLKVGAQVMLAKNLNVQEGLVNGARGVVVSFDRSLEDAPVVRLKSGRTITLTPERFIMRCGGQIFQRRQLPLRLAWAFSIHRSQGMSLDSVEISLARVFEAGQAYVALSRARSLAGLRVLDFTPSSIVADQEVLNFYKRLAKDLGIRLTD